MMKQLLLSVIVLAILAGCTAIQEPMSEKPIHFHKDYKETGLLFGTVTFTDEQAEHDVYYLYFEAIGDSKTKRKNSSQVILYIKPFGKKYDGDLNQNRTYLFAFEKPPGKYQVSRLTVKDFYYKTASSGFVDLRTQSFEIKKGEIAYLGELQFNHAAGLQTPKVVNQFKRDVVEFKKRSAFVNWDSATIKSESL